MTDSPSDDDDLNVLSPSDALELVLDLAQRQAARATGVRGPKEADRLADAAALEQVDYLLMEHWEALDALARTVPMAENSKVQAGRFIWRLRTGVRVELSPAAAVERVVELAERELALQGTPPGSEQDAVRWARHFLERRHADLNARFGRIMG